MNPWTVTDHALRGHVGGGDQRWKGTPGQVDSHSQGGHTETDQYRVDNKSNLHVLDWMFHYDDHCIDS